MEFYARSATDLSTRVVGAPLYTQQRSGRVYYSAGSIGNFVFSVGDVVKLRMAEDDAPGYLGLVRQIWLHQSSSTPHINAQWFFRPEETHTGRTMSHEANQVFLSADEDANPLSAVVPGAVTMTWGQSAAETTSQQSQQSQPNADTEVVDPDWFVCASCTSSNAASLKVCLVCAEPSPATVAEEASVSTSLTATSTLPQPPPPQPDTFVCLSRYSMSEKRFYPLDAAIVELLSNRHETALRDATSHAPLGCFVCGYNDDQANIVLCDTKHDDGTFCSGEYHVDCVGLSAIPTGDWHCPVCTRANHIPPPSKKRRKKGASVRGGSSVPSSIPLPLPLPRSNSSQTSSALHVRPELARRRSNPPQSQLSRMNSQSQYSLSQGGGGGGGGSDAIGDVDAANVFDPPSLAKRLLGAIDVADLPLLSSRTAPAHTTRASAGKSSAGTCEATLVWTPLRSVAMVRRTSARSVGSNEVRPHTHSASASAAVGLELDLAIEAPLTIDEFIATVRRAKGAVGAASSAAMDAGEDGEEEEETSSEYVPPGSCSVAVTLAATVGAAGTASSSAGGAGVVVPSVRTPRTRRGAARRMMGTGMLGEAMRLLHANDYRCGDALEDISRVHVDTAALLPDAALVTECRASAVVWTAEEQRTFESELKHRGKLFNEIARAIGTRTTKDAVAFYYMHHKRLRPADHKRPKRRSRNSKRPAATSLDELVATGSTCAPLQWSCHLCTFINKQTQFKCQMCSTKRKKQETARSKRARSSSTSVTAEMEIDGESAAGDGGAQGRRQSNGGDSNAGAASASAAVAVAAKVVGAAPIGLPTHRLFNLKPAAMQLESKLVVQEFPRSGELEQGRGGGGRGDWGGTNAVDANASSTAAGATPLPITALESRALEAKQKQKQKQKRKRSRSAERDDTDSRIFHLTRRAHDFVRRVNRSFEVEEESAQRLAAAAVVEPGGYAENKQMLLSNVMRDFAKGACDVSTTIANVKRLLGNRPALTKELEDLLRS